jgi:hypothetical protein
MKDYDFKINDGRQNLYEIYHYSLKWINQWGFNS